MAFGRLSIVLSTHAAQFEAVAFKGDLAANLARVAALGYTGVELAIRDPALVDAHQLKASLAALGLGLPAIGTGQAWAEERLSFASADIAVRKAARSRIISQVELAQQFNALVIIGLIRGITPAGQSKSQSMGYLIEGLQECAVDALERGVRIAFEPLNRYETDLVHTVDESLELIEEVGFTNLGLLLDTFHMNIEEPEIFKSIQRAADKIFHFHVADSNRWYPGAGHLDFKAILKALKSTGYTGWISGEFMPLPDAYFAAQQNYEHLARLLKQI